MQCTVLNSLNNKFPWTHAGETVWALQSHWPRDDSCSPSVKFLSNMLLCVQINKWQHQDLQRNRLTLIKYCLLLSVGAVVGITLENYIPFILCLWQNILQQVTRYTLNKLSHRALKDVTSYSSYLKYIFNWSYFVETFLYIYIKLEWNCLVYFVLSCFFILKCNGNSSTEGAVVSTNASQQEGFSDFQSCFFSAPGNSCQLCWESEQIAIIIFTNLYSWLSQCWDVSETFSGTRPL